MTSKAFTKGFVDGFTAPFSFFDRRAMVPDDYRTTVDSAWEVVGDAFQKSMPKERGELGQVRYTKKRRHSGKRAA